MMCNIPAIKIEGGKSINSGSSDIGISSIGLGSAYTTASATAMGSMSDPSGACPSVGESPMSH